MLVILKKTYIRNGVVYIQHDRVYKILHITKLCFLISILVAIFEMKNITTLAAKLLSLSNLYVEITSRRWST